MKVKTVYIYRDSTGNLITNPLYDTLEGIIKEHPHNEITIGYVIAYSNGLIHPFSERPYLNKFDALNGLVKLGKSVEGLASINISIKSSKVCFELKSVNEEYDTPDAICEYLEKKGQELNSKNANISTYEYLLKLDNTVRSMAEDGIIITQRELPDHIVLPSGYSILAKLPRKDKEN